MFNFGLVTEWIDNWLESLMPQWAATTVECLLIGLALILAY